MYKYSGLFLIALCAALAPPAQAQLLERQVIGSFGASEENANGQLSYTGGQVDFTHYENGTVLLTQGFQQGYADVTEAAPAQLPPELALYPNPAATSATLRCRFNEAGKLQTAVTDLTGKVVIAASEHSCPVAETLELPLELKGLTAGVYLVHLSHTASSGTATHFAIKLVVQH